MQYPFSEFALIYLNDTIHFWFEFHLFPTNDNLISLRMNNAPLGACVCVHVWNMFSLPIHPMFGL